MPHFDGRTLYITDLERTLAFYAAEPLGLTATETNPGHAVLNCGPGIDVKVVPPGTPPGPVVSELLLVTPWTREQVVAELRTHDIAFEEVVDDCDPPRLRFQDPDGIPVSIVSLADLQQSP